MALNSCCCCVPLRTGALIIASLYIVMNSGVLLGWAGWALAEYVAISADSSGEYESRHKRQLMFPVYMLLGLLGLCGINITVDSLLVHGIRRNRRKFMLPWVIWYGVFDALATLSWLGICIWLLVGVIHDLQNPHDGMGIGIAFLITIGSVGLIAFPVAWFWYACVVSYYQVLAPSDAYVMEPLRDKGTGDTS